MPSQVARSTPRSAGSPPRRRRSTGPLRQLPLPGEHAVDVGLVPLECADERRVLRMAELVILNLAGEHRARSVRSGHSLRHQRVLLQGVVVVRGRGLLGGGRCGRWLRSEEHTAALQSLMRISYAVFCLKKKKK